MTNGTALTAGEPKCFGAENHLEASPKLVPKSAGRYYRPELDAVRLLAFTLVFLHHALPIEPVSSLSSGLAQILYACKSASGFGLCLFFSLSAYLICELLLQERETTGTILAKRFYIRRILRIWPLYFAGLAIALVIAILPGGDRCAIPWVGWSTILLGNWFVVFHGMPSNPMSPLWSISVEEQFYLFSPLAIKYLSRGLLYCFSISIIVVANVWLFFHGTMRVAENATWTNSFVQFENFAAGLLLCLTVHGKRNRISAWQRLTSLVAWAFCWFCASHALGIRYLGNATPGRSPLIGGYGLVALGCCFLLVAFLGLDRKVIPGWAIYLGRISFGLYVFHLLSLKIVVSSPPHHYRFGALTMFFKGSCALGLTLLLASLSYRYLEGPFLRLKKRFEVIESRPL